jgi:RHS repeat-associated protein
MAARYEVRNGFPRVGMFLIALLIGIFVCNPAWADVNVANGNLSYSQTLFRLPNAKSLGEFVLTYNSVSSQNDVLGKGWTHTFNIRLNPTVGDSSAYTLTRGDGSKVVFRGTGNPYKPDNSAYPRLTVNQNGTYSMEHRDGITYAFNGDGMITGITDRNSNGLSLSYTSGYLTGIADSNGRSISIGYDGGKIADISEPYGITEANTHTFSYTGADLTGISSTISGLGIPNVQTNVQTWAFAYWENMSSFLHTVTDPKGYVTTYEYTNFKLSKVTDPEGRYRTIAYYPATSQTQITEKDGGPWTYIYNSSLGALTEIDGPEGYKETYTYNSQNNLIETITDQRNVITAYTYTATGNVETVTLKRLVPSSQTYRITTYTYGDATNNPNKATQIEYPYDIGGSQRQYNATVQMSYDTRGNLTWLKDAEANEWNFSYYAFENAAQGELEKITLPDPYDGSQIKFYYTNHFLTQITEPLPPNNPPEVNTYFGYDDAGNVNKIYRDYPSQSDKTQFLYNGLNKIKKVTNALNKETNFAYDLNGNLLSVSDASTPPKVTQYEHNYRGQTTKMTDALSNVTQFVYGTRCPSCGGGVDNLTSVTDAKGNTTKFEYYQDGKIKSETDPLGHVRSYTYTINSTTNKAVLTDANGNVIEYHYDDLNRPQKVVAGAQTVKYFTYNAWGNLETASDKETSPDVSYTFGYDKNNRLTSSALTAYGTQKSVGYGYNSLGNREAMTTPDGRSITYDYNAGYQLWKVISGTSPGWTFEFRYDELKRLKKIIYPVSVLTTEFGYNAAGFLTDIANKDGQTPAATLSSISYAPDDTGNWQSMTDGYGQRVFTYDGTYQLTDATNPAETFTYDPVGNRLIDGNEEVPTQGLTYIYDYENKLIQVKDGTTVIADYQYDPFGRRIKKTVGTEITWFVYDGPNIVTEYTETGGNWVLKNAYTHTLGIDDPLSIQQGGNFYYYLKDGLGSITGITDNTGVMVKTYRYKAFGEIYAQSGTFNQPFAFTGRESDSESGLYFYRARYYDPKAGRFLTKDPIGFAGGDVNLFRMVQNNPVNYTDPSGLIYAEQFAGYGAITGTIISATGSVFLDAATGGINIAATPAELATGAAIGAAIGYGIGTVLDNYLLARGKGERNWEKGRGDDPYWDKSIDDLKGIEKKSPDPNERERAKKIRKQKQKKDKCP